MNTNTYSPIKLGARAFLPATVTRTGMSALLVGIVLGLLCACPLFAQQTGVGAIYGRVYDADSNRFMPSADVTVEGTAIATVSEQGGFYILNSIPVGEVTVVASYAGYVAEKKTVTVTAGGQVTADFELRLMPTGPIAPGMRGDQKEDKVIILEGLTVTTNRSGNARAFMEQKNAMTMSTVLAADSFGTVQDGNIAEFLRQVPGISVLEDDVTGEASEISLGGMDPQYTGVYMDGVSMATGGGGGFDDDSRTFKFDQLSINGIESIEIRRTVSADMEGDKPAGGISMKAKSAFDRKEAILRYNVFLTANSYSMDFKRTPGADDGKSFKIQPGFNLTYSTPFNNNKMGLMIEAGAQTDFKETNRVTNEINAGSWAAGNPFVSSVAYRNAQTQSERANASVRFDWKISPYSKTSIRLSHDMRDTTTFNRTVTFNYNSPDAGKKGNTTNESNLLVWKKESDSSGIDQFVRVNQSASYKTSNTETITATFDWKRYRFQFNAIAALSYAVTKTNPSHGKWFPQITMIGPNTKYGTWAQRTSSDEMDWSFYRGDLDSMTPYADYMAQFGDITRYGQSSTTSIADPLPSNNKQTIPTLKADLRWDAPTKFPLWLKTGFNARQTKQEAWQPTDSTGSALANNYQYIGPNNLPTQLGYSTGNYDVRGTTSGSGSTDAQPLSSEYFRSPYRFDPHFGGNVASLNIPMFNQTLLYKEFQRSGAYSESNPNGWFYQDPSDRANARIAGYTGKRDLIETIAAGYLMGQARPLKGWIFEAGLRYEYTYQEANTLIPYSKKQVHAMPQFDNSEEVETTDAFIDELYKHGNRTKTTNSYSFLLPSAAVKYEFTPNLVAHLGYSEGFGRISVSKLAGNWSISETNQTATAPNPNLEPDHFKTYSAAVEYYFEPAGSFSFTYSYRMWDGVDYEAQEINSYNFDNPSSELQALIDQYGRETIQEFMNNQYRILTYQPSNKADRTMHTLEFAYRQRIPAIPGLQIDANFTNIIPNWKKTGASGAPKVASGGLSYTNRNLYLRVSANWRDRYYVRWSEDENPEESIDYNGKQGQSARLLLNAELTYRLTKGIYLYATANNILNSPSTVWVYTPDVTREQTLQGVAFRFGVKNYF
jgi:TonB-dependent receptor